MAQEMNKTYLLVKLWKRNGGLVKFAGAVGKKPTEVTRWMGECIPNLALMRMYHMRIITGSELLVLSGARE